MSNQPYSDVIMNHWKSPLNYGTIPSPDIDIEEQNALCGDRIHLTIKVSESRITELLFTNCGCVISKASASIFFETIKGKQINQIREITKESFLSLFPASIISGRLRCALLPYNAMRMSINAYANKKSHNKH